MRTTSPGPWTQRFHRTCNRTIRFETPTYEDVYEQRAGVWKFASRTLHRWFVSTPLEAELRPTIEG